MRLIDHLSHALASSPSYESMLGILDEGRDFTLATPGVVRPLLVAATFRHDPRPILLVVSGEQTAARYARQIAAYLPAEDVLHFADREDLPWQDDAPDTAVVATRARALHGLSTGRPAVVVASARSLIRVLPPQGSHVFEPLELKVGARLDLEETAARLARMGFSRQEQALDRGQFAIRGGTLDVYPADGTRPVRAEFFGDEIETLRRFVPSTGQSIGEAMPIELYPCRELAIGTRSMQAATKALHKKSLEDPQIAHHLDLITAGVYFNGVERYMPIFYKSAGRLTDYLGPNALVAVAEPRSLFDDATRRYEELQTLAKTSQVKLNGLFTSAAELDLGGRQRLTLLSLLRAGGAVDAELVARRPEVAGGESRFIAGIRGLMKAGNTVVLAVPDRRVRESVIDALVDVEVPVESHVRSAVPAVDPVVDGLPASAAPAGGPAGRQTLAQGVVNVFAEEIPAGYVIPSARLATISIDDVYPRSTEARRGAREIDATRMTFGFVPGDYVVHAGHGIALFKMVERKTVLDAERDYLVLEYAKGDRLYVPVEQVDRITKYVGPEGAAPRVTRLNTADWSRATKKARKAARKLAFDLVDLYARRSAVEGRTFASDTPWQMEMEAAFPFEETPDQLAAIADVKNDMESESPMDRLICGDVGYGKTEVAIRAAFKAVMDGSQVMILCPTTILAQQHHTTFSERFAPFDVRVDVLSRFRTKAQQAESIEGFTSGGVDILIGTHRLLSQDVTPHDLGLVIIDEEQRFGVGHKEHLKNLREQVDILTLSATPIPRTLQMSLSGVRDMSVIDTPPPNRFPVQVHVGEYDPDVVSGAIRREVERGGQVYFVSNRVRTIEEAVSRVVEAVPEARVGVGHGQMSEKQLERVMEAFSAGEYDVLVSTTIVESGIDNPHTNTLIIEDSQRLGLAQLYQLKGRVGRSHVRAFAYFLFPRGQSLTEQAAERLTALSEHTELGSGIKVAMRDLEIRGAGTLLGAEQHGNMSAVGFDLYAEMLREAVAEARGEPPIAHPEIRVDLPVPAFLPDEYIDAVDQRVLFYRRLAGAPAIEEVERVRAEISDRFGAPPEPARNLLAIAATRAMAADAQIDTVRATKTRITFSPIKLGEEARGVFAARGATFREKDRSLVFPLEYGGSVTEAVQHILGDILTGAKNEVPDSQEDR